MNHIGLFEGGGGFSFAAKMMGWKTIAWCEWNEFCQQVLKYHYPNAAGHSNIKETDFTIYRGKCDIVTGGFPCQPYSTAGKRLGKDDDRHLWPEMRRAVREISPRWVVGENVRGLTNWNGGLVFDEVQADLEAEGYQVLPFLLPAAGVGAPHRRDRIWFIAYAGHTESQGRILTPEGQQFSRGGGGEAWSFTPSLSSTQITPNTECQRQQGSGWPEGQSGTKADGNWQASWAHADGGWPTQSPVCGRNDGLPAGLSGITVSKHRKESLKVYGNAIVPQVAVEIFKAIEQYELTKS